MLSTCTEPLATASPCIANFNNSSLVNGRSSNPPAATTAATADAAEPPNPEPFDGAPPTTEAAAKWVPLYVGADYHLANEYAPLSPGCHRTFRLFAAGNGSWGGCPTRGSTREPRGAV